MSTPTVDRVDKLHQKPLKQLTVVDAYEIVRWSLESLTYFMYGVDHTAKALDIIKEVRDYCMLLVSYLTKWSVELKVDGVNSKGMVLNDIQYLLKEKPKCIK
ncbi:MAG: hypothetical protein J6R47_02795 [Acholeplasmatales bacterium]|nr:hypothetical protein [Acholeplasmatales bacterium]